MSRPKGPHPLKAKSVYHEEHEGQTKKPEYPMVIGILSSAVWLLNFVSFVVFVVNMFLYERATR